jgi:predicted dehydrogenase
MKRRHFLQRVGAAATAGAIGWLGSARAFGANERVRVGLIGCGTRGRAVGALVSRVEGAEISAVCDLYEPNLTRTREAIAPRAETFRDFRKLLDRDEIDAVILATPDHWHAIPTVMACAAGKDVYVEKPLGHNIREGQAMVAAAEKHKRIVQTGTQQRSAPHFEQIHEIIQSGELGKVHLVRIWNFTNMYPRGMGERVRGFTPSDADWDFFLGPAPIVPYDPKRFVGTYRWFFDYAGGILTDFGTHRIDSMHQVMGVDAPKAVSASGSRFEIDDGGDTPDVLQVTYEYPGFVLSYEACALNGLGAGGQTPGRKYYRAMGEHDRPNGHAYYGTNGTLMADRIGFEIFPEMEPSEGERPRARRYRMKRKEAAAQDATGLHVRNFIECVRSRNKPNADVTIGHKASNACHLGNIAYRTGLKLRWDARSEQIIDDTEASKLLGREARKPWDLI